jgi:hypothetical protein
MMEAVGHAVSRLIRIRYGAMVLPHGLRRSTYMELDEADIRALTHAANKAQSADQRDELGIVGVQKTQDFQENLAISIDALTNNGGTLLITWENTKVSLPFSLNTKAKVLASIDKTMAGPAANDYHAAATYYFNENLDLKKALEWSTKAVELRGPSAYWMTRLKAQLQAANGDYKGAIETAKISIEAAKADGDDAYVRANEKSIEEWSKKR